MKIALFYRVWFDSGEKFLAAARKLGIELTVINYQDLTLSQDEAGVEIFYEVRPLSDFNLFYFRAVGNAEEWANLLVLYAQEKKIPVVDDYLTVWGPSRQPKGISGAILNQAKVSYPRTSLVADRETLLRESEKFSFPFILKVSEGGRHGMGTMLVKDREMMERAIKGRIEKTAFLLQEYIPNDGDYRIFLIGYEILGGFKRQAKEEKLLLNRSAGPSEKLEVVPEAVARVARAAAMALKVEVCAVDMVVDKRDGRPVVVEVNEAPEFKVLEQRLEKDVAGEILKYLVKKAAGEQK